MVKIIKGPWRHARASAGSRAASSVSNSDVKPFSRALSVASTAAHQSAGMNLRWNHLETRLGPFGPASRSAAIASRVGQSSITSQKEPMGDGEVISISEGLGQSVLKCKAFPSLDCGLPIGHNVPMAESETIAEHKQGYISRVKQARVARGLKQWEMAEALNRMPQDKYKQYESRSYLPPHLVRQFCMICRVDPEWLVTGVGKMFPKEPPAPTPEPVQKQVPKRRTKRAA